MPPKHRCPPPPAIRLAGTLAILAAVAGCGNEPSRPHPDFPALSEALHDNTPLPEPKTWKTIAEEWVQPGKATVISASRYTLKFPSKSVSETIRITVRELDEDEVDVEFGPEGTKFLSPVTLVIDYAGTSSDPLSEDYHGKPQAFFWYNPENEVWEEMPSVLDKNGRTITVLLEHFSRYAMYDPAKEGEWQWMSRAPVGSRNSEEVEDSK